MKLKLTAFSAILLCTQLFCFAEVRPVAKKITSTKLSQTQVSINWQFPENTNPKITGITLYDSYKAISSYADIKDAVAIAKLSRTENNYTHTAMDGRVHYYAVIAETDHGEYDIIIPSMNATITGVKVKAAGKAVSKTEETPSEPEVKAPVKKPVDSDMKISSLRETPLPSPEIILGYSSNKVPMSTASKKEAKKFGTKNPVEKNRITEPYFFEEDMYSPESGDEYSLFQTLRGGLARKNYQESVKLFLDFLSVHRNENVTKRSEFYLGESLYFTGNYKDALYYFLLVQDDYPELSRKWIDSTLDFLELNDKNQ